MKQFKDGLSQIRVETVANRIGAEERELSLVVQEICLVAPRLHEAMMQVSRTRRAAINRGLIGEGYQNEVGNTISYEVYTAPNQAEVEIAEIKPRKKKTTKKKKAE